MSGTSNTRKNWTRIKPYGEDAYTYWINGIYKIVSYRAGAYHAYYIPDHYDNWGDHVSPPPHDGQYGKCWNTLAAAKAACDLHGTAHVPAAKTIKRAAAIKASLLAQAEEYRVAA